MSKKRFLTIFFSVLFILLGVVGLFLYEYVRIRPNNVHFTNVTSSSVTVSWNTEKAIPASVRVFEGDRVIPFSVYHDNDRFFDTRDVKEAELLAVQQTANNIVENEDLTVSVDDFQTDVVVTDMGEYYTHHVTVVGLDPETEYSFMVGDEYLFREVEDVNGNTVVSTLQIPEEIKSPFPAYGTVKDANNQEDAVDEDLIDVTDGIVYFNYLDEFSGDKSAVYSSSLNNEGRWYIDVSNAVDENGNPFIDRYYNEITNILVELTIDVGPLGIWKKQVFYPNMAPTEKVVLNFPVEVDKDNIQYPLEKIESSNIIKEILGKSVKSVHAAERYCQCTAWCSWMWSDNGTWVKCTYNELSDAQKATYEARNCKKVEGEIPSGPDEGCNGGKYKENAYACIDTNNCGQCRKRNDGTYYWAQHQTSSSCPSPCGSGGGGNVSQSCFRVSNNTCEPFTYTGDQPNCGSNYTSIEACQASLDGGESSQTCFRVSNNTCELFTYTGDQPNCGSNYTSIEACQASLDEAETMDEEHIKQGDICYISGVDSAVYNSQLECVEVGAICARSGGTTRYWQSDGSCGGVHTVKQGDICYISGVDSAVYNSQLECVEVGAICARSGGTTRYWQSDGSCGGWNQTEEGARAEEDTPISEIDATTEEKGSPIGDIVYSTAIEGIQRGLRIASYISPRPFREFFAISAFGIEYLDDLFNNDVPDILNNNNNYDSFVKQVFAVEEENTFEYLIDQSTEIFTGITEGIYTFKYRGEEYAFYVSNEAIEISGGKLFLYIDENSDGEFDEGIDILVSETAEQIKISPIFQTYYYELTEGFNFISFPYLISDEDSRTAAGLLTKLNEVYDDAFYSISKFDGRWKIVGQNVEIYDNNDFQLLPGEGYMIKAKRDIDISIVGQPVQLETEGDKSPIYMTQGWNLIGLYGTGIKSYTAKTLIEDINKDNFTADNVTKWASDKQMYEGFQLSDGEEYGFDYPLNILESYFVRIIEGKGNWQPSLSGNN
jgi:hypothetical protein